MIFLNIAANFQSSPNETNLGSRSCVAVDRKGKTALEQRSKGGQRKTNWVFLKERFSRVLPLKDFVINWANVTLSPGAKCEWQITLSLWKTGEGGGEGVCYLIKGGSPPPPPSDDLGEFPIWLEPPKSLGPYYCRCLTASSPSQPWDGGDLETGSTTRKRYVHFGQTHFIIDP